MARDPGTGSRRQRPIAFSSPPPKRSFWDKLPGSKIVAQGTKDVGHIVRSAPSGLRDSWDELTAGPKERKQKGYTGNPLLNQAKDMAGIARHPLRNPGYTLALGLGAVPAGKALAPKLPKRPIMNRPKPKFAPAVGGLIGRSADKIDAADLLALKAKQANTPAHQWLEQHGFTVNEKNLAFAQRSMNPGGPGRKIESFAENLRRTLPEGTFKETDRRAGLSHQDRRALDQEMTRGDIVHTYQQNGIPPVWGDGGPIPEFNKPLRSRNDRYGDDWSLPGDRFNSLNRFPDIDNDPYVKYGDQSQEGHPRNFPDEPFDRFLETASERGSRVQNEVDESLNESGAWDLGDGNTGRMSDAEIAHRLGYGDVETENPFDWRPGDEYDDIGAKQDFSVTPGGGDPDLDTAMAGTRDRALLEFLSEQYGGIHPANMDRFQELSQRDAWSDNPSHIRGNRAQDDYADSAFDERRPLKGNRLPRNVRKLNMDDLFRMLDRGHFGPN